MAALKLDSNLRKKEIRDAAMMAFKKKGFLNTTMEDVVALTSLSKGGVYYYYKNTVDIMHDIMIDGMHYRVDIIEAALKNGRYKDDDFMAEQLFAKIVDDNPYMDIYVDFLIAKKNNEKLEKLFQELKEETLKEFENLSKDLDISLLNEKLHIYDLLTDMINSFIIGAEILSARENFSENKSLMVEVFKLILNQRRS
ncbi:MAG: TetR/AcrR family transcriptional regulator [Ezakiella sp.]|nr:TetR/AcrR family transcriptional regulator [Bacillota bacterium]MDY3947482.1 TetR/AcrR family transcriptional regulator [Ezakiella sp.]